MASRRQMEEAPPPAAAPAASENENENGGSSENNQISEKNWPKSDRELLLVVITFVATVAFQAGLSPPGGTWQDDTDQRYIAGKSIMASKYPAQFVTFIAGVTTCMVVSMMQVLVLLNELPYNKLSVSRNFLYVTLGIGFSSMILAYWSSVTALTPEPLIQQIIVTLVSNLVSGFVVLMILLYVQKRRAKSVRVN